MSKLLVEGSGLYVMHVLLVSCGCRVERSVARERSKYVSVLMPRMVTGTRASTALVAFLLRTPELSSRFKSLQAAGPDRSNYCLHS
jgi:hypothetical protein